MNLSSTGGLAIIGTILSRMIAWRVIRSIAVWRDNSARYSKPAPQVRVVTTTPTVSLVSSPNPITKNRITGLRMCGRVMARWLSQRANAALKNWNVQVILNREFKLMDADNDGHVSKMEFVNSRQPSKGASALRDFARADKNGDGKLCPEELAAASAQKSSSTLRSPNTHRIPDIASRGPSGLSQEEKAKVAVRCSAAAACVGVSVYCRLPSHMHITLQQNTDCLMQNSCDGPVQLKTRGAALQ